MQYYLRLRCPAILRRRHGVAFTEALVEGTAVGEAVHLDDESHGLVGRRIMVRLSLHISLRFGLSLRQPLPAPLRGGAGGGVCCAFLIVLVAFVEAVGFPADAVAVADALCAVAAGEDVALVLQLHYLHRRLLIFFLNHNSFHFNPCIIAAPYQGALNV